MAASSLHLAPVPVSLGPAKEKANIFSCLVFGWVWKLIRKGKNGQLGDVSDLFSLPKSLEVLKNEKLLDTSINKVVCSNSALNKKSNIILKSLLQTFGLEYFLLGFLQLITDLLGFAAPILLGHIVTFVETDSEPMLNGYLYALGMFGSTLGQLFISNQLSYCITGIVVKMKGALCCAIYKKTLSVSTSSLSKLSSGEIIDMMSTDVDRIVNFAPSFHELWSLPVQILISLYLIYNQIGTAFVSCIVYGLFLIPFTHFLCTKVMKYETNFMEFKDDRVKLMNEILKGFRVVKYYAWDVEFKKKVNVVRSKELKQLKYSKYVDALCVFFWQMTPLLMSLASFTLYILLGNQLTASKVFTCVALFGMLLVPLNAFPWVIGGILESWVSIKRVQKLFELPDVIKGSYYSSEKCNNGDVNITNGHFVWHKSVKSDVDQIHTDEEGNNKTNEVDCSNDTQCDSSSTSESSDERKGFKLTDINITCHMGQFIGLVGKIGSGKSSLFNGILSEMCKIEGDVQVCDEVQLSGFGLYTQDPWIQQGTIKENILFGKEYNHEYYQSVLKACALDDDLKILPSGDSSEVGENGLMLSGGQKARIALARAIYQDKDIYLLDDPFSAVDADVAKHIYDHCIRGLLRSKTLILSTHYIKFLHEADHVIALENGHIIQQGPPKEVLSLPVIIKSISLDDDDPKPKIVTTEEEGKDEITQEPVIKDEEKEEGAVKAEIYAVYWRAVGSGIGIIFLIFLLLMQASQNASELWLAHWLSDFKATNASSHDVKFYLTIYGSIAAASSIFTLGRAFLFAYGCIHAAIVIHKKLLEKILVMTLKFFESTPLGRILNRFSTDINNIDDILPFILNIVVASFIQLIGMIVVISYSLVWIILVIVPLVLIYLLLQHIYRKTSREVKRLCSVSMSPIYTHFSESLSGLVIIRAFSENDRMCDNIRKKVSSYLSAYLTEAAASCWFSFHLELLGVILITAVSFMVVIQRHFGSLDAGYVGLAISSAIAIEQTLCELVIHFTELEKIMVSVERANQYIEGADTEKDDGIINSPEEWPDKGVVKYDDVHLQYRTNLPFALQGINFETKPSEKIGVVGRTGSGKSSMLSLLFSIVEHQKGEIFIDGINISHLPLHQLRSRITIIPQDTFLFSGTVRENLDPVHKYSDDELWKALELCELKNTILNRPDALNGEVGELGKELSAGQKQLMCLARAVLINSKVLCIDEATAHVDLETDKLIQSTIQKVFKNKTVITIAHRLDTIMHCDRVIVMQEGKIVEFDSPEILLQDTQSHFYTLHQKVQS
ncbi:Multidrug resistance-associated protein 7 [Nymphon striatum]|nr:Multidrug resistance-associated protein 7 [Nymphon striatum]